MNISLLKLVNRNLMSWLSPQHVGVSDSKKLDVIMVSLADICAALATDGTRESITEFHEKD